MHLTLQGVRLIYIFVMRLISAHVRQAKITHLFHVTSSASVKNHSEEKEKLDKCNPGIKEECVSEVYHDKHSFLTTVHIFVLHETDDTYSPLFTLCPFYKCLWEFIVTHLLNFRQVTYISVINSPPQKKCLQTYEPMFLQISKVTYAHIWLRRRLLLGDTVATSRLPFSS